MLAKDLSPESLQKSSPDPPQEHDITCSITTASSTIRRNPTYGLIEVALENYTHIDNPATAPILRGPQSFPDGSRAASNKVSESVHSNSSSIQSRAPQEITSGPSDDFVETMVKARLGEKDAQVTLANMYRDGKGVLDQDYQAAMDWYRKAAEQGSAEAQHNVGSIYCSGDGVPQDYSLAMEWYRMSAKQGYAESQREVGMMYMLCQGVSEDYVRAMEWLRKAADQGDAIAQCNIGHLYYHGLDVPQDDAQAVDWYRKAAEQGHSTSQYNLGVMYSQGRGVPKNQEKAIEWHKMAADQGHEKAKNEVDRLERQDVRVQTQNTKPGLFKRLFY
jgi:hypothetical protein